MDNLSQSAAPSPQNPASNNIESMTRIDSPYSDSSLTTREALSRNSNSTESLSSSSNSNIVHENVRQNSPSSAVGNFEGASVSVSPNPALPPHLRNRILRNTPGTSAFARETRIGTVHPARATQLGIQGASIEASEERRNRSPLQNPSFQNPIPVIEIHDPYQIPIFLQRPTGRKNLLKGNILPRRKD